MPILTPNRIADPVSLEGYEPPCILRQEGGLFIPFKNTTADKCYVAGEPVFYFGRTCIVQKTILPGKIGTLISDFMVDALLSLAHTGNITQDSIVYWSLALNAAKIIGTETTSSGLGAATNQIPANGFMLGRAVYVNHGDDYPAVTGSKRVRVVSLPGTPTVYGTYY